MNFVYFRNEVFSDERRLLNIVLLETLNIYIRFIIPVVFFDHVLRFTFEHFRKYMFDERLRLVVDQCHTVATLYPKSNTAFTIIDCGKSKRINNVKRDKKVIDRIAFNH